MKEKVLGLAVFFLLFSAAFAAWSPQMVEQAKEEALEHFQGRVVQINDFIEEALSPCSDEKIATIEVSRVFKTARGIKKGYNVEVIYPEEISTTKCGGPKLVEALALGDEVEVWANEVSEGSPEFRGTGAGYTFEIIKKNETVRGATIALGLGVLFIAVFVLIIAGQKVKYRKKK